MQRMTLPAELAKRLNLSIGSAVTARNALRNELDAQTQAYLKSGKKIDEIPRGASAVTDGLIPPCTDPGKSLGITRPTEKQREKSKAKIEARKKAQLDARAADLAAATNNGQLVSKSEAAEMLGYSSTDLLGLHIRRQQISLTLVKRYRSRAYYARAEVEALAAARKRAT